MDRRSLLKLIGSSTLVGTLGSVKAGLAIENSHDTSITENPFGTGIEVLDDYFGPVGPGDVIAIAGQVFSGKTSLALTIADHICGVHGKDVIYWGPHIDQDPKLGTALQTLSKERAGTLRLRCMHEAFDKISSVSDALGLLIVDDFEYRLALHDPNWRQNPELLAGKLGELKLFAVENRCLILPLMTIHIEGDWPRDPPLPAWPELPDLGMLGPEIQRMGRIALLYRPELCVQGYGDIWPNCTGVALPRQCSRAADNGGDLLLVINKDTGLFRTLKDKESLSFHCKAIDV